MTEFPEIKRANIKELHDEYYVFGLLADCTCDYEDAFFVERRSRGAWAKALLNELEFFDPKTGVKLEILNVNLARVKAELKRVAEEDLFKQSLGALMMMLWGAIFVLGSKAEIINSLGWVLSLSGTTLFIIFQLELARAHEVKKHG